MNKAQTIKALHEIAERCRGDEEEAHIEADAVLLAAASPDVREAYEAVKVAAGGWWYA